MFKNWIVAQFNALPLWGKIVAPVAVVLLVLVALRLVKFAIWLGLLALVAYFFMSMFGGDKAGNKTE
ncbi:MAG: hypothetical protein NW241_15870 [Bacteroidia bacterium]|nr:hypothetical protein [Bacteroidia bacterium]